MTDTNQRAKTWARSVCYAAKSRAAAREVPFDLTPSDILDVATVLCPITQRPLDYSAGKGRGRHRAESPALDRLRPEQGYVPGNVAVISNRMNRIKSSATPEELVALGKWAGRVIKATEVVDVT